MKNISAWIRCNVWGFCPECNSDAPKLYDCPVCEYDTKNPKRKRSEKRDWWNKYKEYHKTLKIYLDFKERSLSLPDKGLMYYILGLDGVADEKPIYAHLMNFDRSDVEIVMEMVVVSQDAGFMFWIISEEGNKFVYDNIVELQNEYGKDFEIVHQQVAGRIL